MAVLDKLRMADLWASPKIPHWDKLTRYPAGAGRLSVSIQNV
jgi:hypothetical protein